jgi:hypothetical protein
VLRRACGAAPPCGYAPLGGIGAGRWMMGARLGFDLGQRGFRPWIDDLAARIKWAIPVRWGGFAPFDQDPVTQIRSRFIKPQPLISDPRAHIAYRFI